MKCELCGAQNPLVTIGCALGKLCAKCWLEVTDQKRKKDEKRSGKSN